MPVPASANPVPFLGPRSRYAILNTTPTWVYHKMAGGSSLDGTPTQTASTDADHTDPVVSAGRAEYQNLTHGGLFTSLAHYRYPMMVEALDNPGSATITIVDATGTLVRSAPTAPFLVAAGECLKASGGSAGGKIGFLVRISETKII